VFRALGQAEANRIVLDPFCTGVWGHVGHTALPDVIHTGQSAVGEATVAYSLVESRLVRFTDA
jgi:ribulose kinase